MSLSDEWLLQQYTTKYQNSFISSTPSLSELLHLSDNRGENKQHISTVEAKLSPVRYQTNSILLLFKRMASLIMKITLIQILLVQNSQKLLLEYLHLLYNHHLIVATTCQNSTCSMLTSAKLIEGYLVVGTTRKLNKEPLLHCYPIYISYR